MRVVCDNCAATYKIPEHKLVREVNKATCRRCGHGIIIRKSGASYESVAPAADGESTQITSQEELEARARAQAQAHQSGSYSSFGFGDQEEISEDVPPTVIDPPGEATVPRPDVGGSAPRPNPTLAPAPSAPPRPPPAPKPTTKAPPPPAAAAPAPQAGVPIQQLQKQGHDPSGDLALVMMCALGAMAGASLMAVTADHTLEVIGLAIALACGITSLLVLATGDRGRKEASVVLSMALGLFIAGGAAAAVKFTGVGAAPDVVAEATSTEKVKLGGTEIPEGAFNDAVAEDENPEPTEEERADALAAALLEMEKADAEDSEEDALAELDEPEEEAPKISAPKTTVQRKTAADVERKSTSSGSTKSTSGSTKSTSGSTKSSSGTTGPSAQPKSTSSSSSSSGNVGVPVTVLDTMLKSNKGVKRCFGLYRQETGSLPTGRITVKLSIQPTGRASTARIDGGQYAGTSLDTCLGSAITKITFPPWDGPDAATYYYPFIL